jgi:hypothetical protein
MRRRRIDLPLSFCCLFEVYAFKHFVLFLQFRTRALADAQRQLKRFLARIFHGPVRNAGLARKNHAKAEAPSSLRARKALRQTLRVCLRACLNLNESKQTVIKLFSLKSSPESFRGCHSLHRSQISKDL